MTTTTDRRCRDCGATTGLIMRVPLLAARYWECIEGCTDEAITLNVDAGAARVQAEADQLNETGTLDLDAICARVTQYRSAIGPGGNKAWLAGELAGRVPALIAEVLLWRASAKHRLDELVRARGEIGRQDAEIQRLRAELASRPSVPASVTVDAERVLEEIRADQRARGGESR